MTNYKAMITARPFCKGGEEFQPSRPRKHEEPLGTNLLAMASTLRGMASNLLVIDSFLGSQNLDTSRAFALIMFSKLASGELAENFENLSARHSTNWCQNVSNTLMVGQLSGLRGPSVFDATATW